MPQHLWHEFSRTRFCEVCFTWQPRERDGSWAPIVGPICPGDDEDGGSRPGRRQPNAPSGGAPPVRTLEFA
jgi:hypothetical protein